VPLSLSFQKERRRKSFYIPFLLKNKIKNKNSTPYNRRAICMSRICFVAVGRICMINIFSDTQITEKKHNVE
jgi:hypothetical protein